ncbi:hypothetical protein ES705_36713 [subsurface metagenome]
MLQVAQKNYPGIQFFNKNMIDFDINIEFGVIICLYGSIGFVQTRDNLFKALKSFENHLVAGGILIFSALVYKRTF